MASKVKICNRALTRLGQARITSLSDDTAPARACNAIFDDVAEDVISMGSWPSATFRASLAQSATTPEWGYDYQYQLPTDPKCLSVISINECKPGLIDHRIENGYLLTDETSVDIKYIGYIDNTESYDTYLKQAIAWALTAELAYSMQGKDSAAEKMTAYAEKKIQALLAEASVQGSNDQFTSDSFIDIRE